MNKSTFDKSTLVKIAISVAALTPLLVSAATLTDALTTTDGILRQIIPILMVLATVIFLWGVILYVVAGSDEEKVERAKGFIITGLIGLFVMVAIWAAVRVLVSTYGLGSTGTIPPGPGDIRP